LEKALVLNEKLYGTEHIDIAIEKSSIGLTYEAKGEPDKAIEYLEKALFMMQKFVPSNHVHITTIQEKLDSCLKKINKLN